VDLGAAQFELPADLRFRTNGFAASVEAVDAYYSNVELGSACAANGPCGWPVAALPPGGIIVSWGNFSGVAPLGEVPNATIAAQPARLTRERPGVCAVIEADETITLRVITETGFNELKMQACLRAPNLDAAELLIDRMVASVTITSP
jgi:hypothetical protein